MDTILWDQPAGSADRIFLLGSSFVQAIYDMNIVASTEYNAANTATLLFLRRASYYSVRTKASERVSESRLFRLKVAWVKCQ